MIVISAWRQALMTCLVHPGRRSALLRPAGAVLYQRVGGRHEHALVTVLPPDQIRRCAILPVDLHDHAPAVHVTHVPAPDQQLITCNRAHRHPSSALMPRRSRRCFRRNRAKGPRYCILDMHVDGFRFDLAAALARELHDVDRLAAFFGLVQQDLVISQVKLIAEPWDVRKGGYQVGKFPPLWSEWNGKYRDYVRDLWRGEPTLPEFALRSLSCGCRKPRPCHASRRYSLIRPPARACFRTPYCSRSTGSGSGFSGAAPSSDR